MLDEFRAADVVVSGAPMSNFGRRTLKAWIDRIAVAGKTFRYGAGFEWGRCASVPPHQLAACLR